jgi:protein-S-isoprenylcysteine O-methyltransferase Ste14
LFSGLSSESVSGLLQITGYHPRMQLMEDGHLTFTHGIVIFIVISLVLTIVSRASLLKPRSHGFYRFIAWEFMLLMFVLDLPAWSNSPHSWHQEVAGWLFFVSLLLALFGFGLLHNSGKPDKKRDDSPMIGIEKTTALVTHGIYRYIRHPIYASLLLLCWGFFFKQPTLAGGIFGTIASISLVATARAEEGENIRYFGDKYREYMKRSKMFIPFIL